MSWTDVRVATLKSLWADGHSASQIEKILGGVTRNAVIGKVRRLGLVGRATLPRKGRPPSAVGTKRPVAKSAEIIREEEPIMLDDGSFATILTVTDRMCHWPIGDPCNTAFHFCGRQPKTGTPYCEAHARKAYQPQVQRRDRRVAA